MTGADVNLLGLFVALAAHVTIAPPAVRTLAGHILHSPPGPARSSRPRTGPGSRVRGRNAAPGQVNGGRPRTRTNLNQPERQP
jgi:hypothetical protein